MRLGAAFALAMLTASIATALAGDHAGLVHRRREAMKQMAAAARTINSMFEGKVPYDRQRFIGEAQIIWSHSGPNLVAVFPKETLGPPSAAKVSIATDPDEFAVLAGRLREYSSALTGKAADRLTPAMRMGADKGAGASSLLGRRAQAPESLQSTPAEHVFHLMLQSCTACHARYREEPLQP